MKRIISIVFMASISAMAISQNVVMRRFIVESGSYQRVNTPVSADISDLNINDTIPFQLYELVKGKETPVQAQVETGYGSRLWWILEGTTPAGGKREFVLKQAGKAAADGSIKLKSENGLLRISRSGVPVLDYNMKLVYPPAGVDTMYKRNGFIHPLYSPSGNVLTRINAPDHYHHVGIWNPWTKVKIRDHITDFWNLYLHQGTVRFAGINSITEGPVYGGFNVRQEHIDFQGKRPEEITFNEVWDVRAWSSDPGTGGKAWLVDLTTYLSVAGDSEIVLEAYRYGGGIGFRATAEWDKTNSWVNTSEGKTRTNADGTRARWTDVGGMFREKGESGIVFMSHPSNREYPEPMRVWPVDQNGRGDVYFEFCPIRHKEWILYPGSTYRLKYRMLVYDGRVDKDVSERIWTDFAYPPAVKTIYKQHTD
jgi:hypothetical protein